MTPTRARQLLDLKRELFQSDFPFAFRQSFRCSTWEPDPRGITEEEHAFVGKVWDTMPGWTCYYDAVVLIANGFTIWNKKPEFLVES